MRRSPLNAHGYDDTTLGIVSSIKAHAIAGEDFMRSLVLTVAALLVSAVPAQAAWSYYSCASDNFAAQFPDVPKMETVKFTMPRHKDALSARTYTTTVDNVVFKMLVADYSDRAAFGASILEEALFQHTEADDHG